MSCLDSRLGTAIRLGEDGYSYDGVARFVLECVTQIPTRICKELLQQVQRYTDRNQLSLHCTKILTSISFQYTYQNRYIKINIHQLENLNCYNVIKIK